MKLSLLFAMTKLADYGVLPDALIKQQSQQAALNLIVGIVMPHMVISIPINVFREGKNYN